MEYLLAFIVLSIGLAAFWYAVYRSNVRKAEQARQKKHEADAARIKELSRRMAQAAAEEKEREKLRQHPNYNSSRFNPMNPDVLFPVYNDSARPTSDLSNRARARQQTQVVGNNRVGIQSRGNVVYDGSSDDLLTAMILQNAMNSQDDTPAITPKSSWDREESYTAPEPERKSSYTSSYSDSSDTSSPSHSGYSSSSSNSDSSSRSSYSSSYSDSSSSSDYSSSSSDSSSSSWD